MTSILVPHLHAMLGRCLPALLALQPAAQPSSGGGRSSGGAPSGLPSLLMPVLIVAFIYFVMLRPMNKQKKEQEQLNRSLRKGDRVVMNSGMLGTIVGLDDRYATIEIAERVRVKFLRESIQRRDEPVATAGSETRGAETPAPKKS